MTVPLAGAIQRGFIWNRLCNCSRQEPDFDGVMIARGILHGQNQPQQARAAVAEFASCWGKVKEPHLEQSMVQTQAQLVEDVVVETLALYLTT